MSMKGTFGTFMSPIQYTVRIAVIPHEILSANLNTIVLNDDVFIKKKMCVK